MDLNLLPEGARPPVGGPSIGLSLEGLRREDIVGRIHAASGGGFFGVEIPVSGEPWSLHAPAVTPDERATLRGALDTLRDVALIAPSQATFDLSLVSPSAAIRRASVSELWSVCRLAGALRRTPESLPPPVIVRTGVSPVGMMSARENAALSECLTTLDRMAGEHGATVALLNADFFRDLRRFPALRSLSLKHTGAALDASLALDCGVTGSDLAEFALESDGLLRHVRVPDTITREIEPLASVLAEARYEGMICVVASQPVPDPVRIARVRHWWSETLGLPTAAGDEIAD